MTVPVAQASSLVHKVPAMEVIGKAVGIVVLALGTILLGLIGPDIVLQVGMLDVNTRIKDGDNGTLVGEGFLFLEEIHL